MKRKLFGMFLTIVIGLVFTMPAVADLTALDIVTKSLSRESGKTKIVEIEMVIRRGSSTKSRVFTQWQKEYAGESKKLVVFKKPAQMNGTAFLSWENKDRSDDQWLYMASRKQIRRIASSDQSASFLGSDLSYEDMGEENPNMRTHKIVEETQLNGRKVWLVESELKPGFSSAYYSAKSWFDQETFISLRTEGIDKNGKLVKSIDCKEYKNVDGVWTVMLLEVTPLGGKTSTTLKMNNVQYGVDIADSKFKKQALKRF